MVGTILLLILLTGCATEERACTQTQTGGASVAALPERKKDTSRPEPTPTPQQETACR